MSKGVESDENSANWTVDDGVSVLFGEMSDDHLKRKYWREIGFSVLISSTEGVYFSGPQRKIEFYYVFTLKPFLSLFANVIKVGIM